MCYPLPRSIMPEDGDGDLEAAEASGSAPAGEDSAVEAYETDEGVVLYDAGNPLAWIESRAPVRLDDAA